MKKLVLSFAAATLAMVIVGCSEKAKNPVGFGLVDEDDHWQTNQVLIYDVLADSCIAVSTGAGGGYYLLVGSWDGQETRGLLLFEELPDTLSWPLTGAKLILTAYAEANEDSLSISVHAVQSEWADSTVTWENPWAEDGGDFDPTPIAEETYALIMGNQMELDFTGTGLELVDKWLQNQSNNGVILKAIDPQGDNLKYFYATSTPYDPKLELTFATSDTTDTTLSAEADRDAFIAQPGDPMPEDFLCVSDGIVRRIWIYFDLCPIPDSVFVNKATLSLSVSEFSAPRDKMSIGAYVVTDMETLDFSTDNSGLATLYADEDILEIDLTDAVQNWVDGTQNAGLMLKAAWEYSDLAQALFFGSTADSLHRPQLTVLYTLPPRSSLTCQAQGDQIQ